MTSPKITRSQNMALIKSANTKPELQVRSILHNLGFRFRLNDKSLPGTPDIILPKYKSVIFVHGCFWHRHKGCKRSSFPKNNAEFWNQKFEKNIKRDKESTKLLIQQGWRVLIIWQCELNDTERVAIKLLNFLS